MILCWIAIHGYANNLNSRAPVPVLRDSQKKMWAAAHVARGLQSMGYNGKIFGVVGDDKAGAKIIQYLEENVETLAFYY